jgi:DNA-binding MarR family transcriptional regulator
MDGGHKGGHTMTEKTTLDLTQDLFQLMKRFPRPRLKHTSSAGLTRSEYELLVLLVMNLDDEKKALSVTEIRSLLQITSAGVTHLINPLEEAGYIERLQAPQDRRIVLIGLTHGGAKVARALMGDVKRQFLSLVNHLGVEDSKTLIRLMARAIEWYDDRS